MKRWGGKMKLDREVSRWLLKVRREPADEAPLVVPKVTRQYTRKKKVSPAEPTKEPVTPHVATVCSGLSVSKVEVDNHNHVKIKEEYIPDIKILNVGVENDIQTIEQNASLSKNSALTLDRNSDIIKKENLIEIKTKGKNPQQIFSSKVINTVIAKQDSLSEKKTTNSNVSEREQEPPRMDITIKIETADDSECTDLDQNNITGCHLEEGKAFRVKQETNTITSGSYTSDKMDEGKNVELEMINEGNHLQHEKLLTEEIIIKDEIESDSDDSKITVNEGSVDEETVVEPLKIMGDTNGSELVPQGNGDVFKINNRKPDLTTLKKCYLVAVDVALTTNAGSSIATQYILLWRPTRHQEQHQQASYGYDDNDVLPARRIRRRRHPDNIDLESGNITCVLESDLQNQRANFVVRNVNQKPTELRVMSFYLQQVLIPLANSQQVLDPENLMGFKVVSKSQIFTCDMCSGNFLSKAALQKHMRGEHSVATPYHCHCGSRFSHNFMLLAHTRGHTGSFVCDLCPKRFASTQKLALHLNTHLRERLFSCPVCGRRYPVLYNLQRHAARHKTFDIFQCGSCSETYRCTFDLRRHSERDHGEKVDFPCYVCDQTLSSNAEHLAHVKSHDNALHECAFCSMRFTDLHKWEAHSAAHIEQLDAVAPVLMPYVCGVCKKRFEFRSFLRTHMRSHTGERPYECKECHKTFKTRSAVSEHEKGHDRPYPCTECPARFAKRDSLSRHLLLHSGERPHVCPSCGRAFTQRSAMRQHVQRFHTPGLKRARAGKRKTKTKK